jgi:DNA-binding transcriptional regulator YhcF (GntR family)
MKFDDSVPIYLQIKKELETAIISGALKEDEPIPSIRVLAQDYRVNPQTISNAITELLNEEMLYKKRGIGMFVNPGAKDNLIRKKNLEFRQKDLIKIVEISKALGIEKEELIEEIRKIYEGGEK